MANTNRQAGSKDPIHTTRRNEDPVGLWSVETRPRSAPPNYLLDPPKPAQ